MPEKIGFVGVGRMGSNMARRLKDCGYEIAAAAVGELGHPARLLARVVAARQGREADEELEARAGEDGGRERLRGPARIMYEFTHIHSNILEC